MRFASLFNKLGKSHSKKSYEQLVHADVEMKSSSKKTMKCGSTPKGCCIEFFVGEEEKKYPVPIMFLWHPKLREFLKECQGPLFDPRIGEPIVLQCSTETFDQLLLYIAKDQ